MPVPVKAFQNIKKKKMLPNQFYRASITLIPMPKRKLLKNKATKSLINTEAKKISNSSKLAPNYMIKWGWSQECKNG